jgi:hypothetical protein
MTTKWEELCDSYEVGRQGFKAYEQKCKNFATVFAAKVEQFLGAGVIKATGKGELQSAGKWVFPFSIELSEALPCSLAYVFVERTTEGGVPDKRVGVIVKILDEETELLDLPDGENGFPSLCQNVFALARAVCANPYQSFAREKNPQRFGMK